MKQLTFGNNFNQPLEQDVLPGSLKQLTFSDNFNQPLENLFLPMNIEIFRKRSLNQPLDPGSLHQILNL